MTDAMIIERVANGWIVHPPAHYAQWEGISTIHMWRVYQTVEQLQQALPDLLTKDPFSVTGEKQLVCK